MKFPDTETAEIYNLYDMEKFRYVQDSEKIDVLDEVPSYDEYIELVSKTEQLQKRLKIATKALKEYMTFCRHPAEEALKEMEGVKW